VTRAGPDGAASGVPAVDPPRRGRPGYDQPTVLRRAVDLFNRQGYDATSMSDLAAELGLSKSALYHHVPSKASLLHEALDEALDALERALDAASSNPGRSAYDRLRDAVRSSVTVLVGHLPAVTLLLRVRGNGPVEVEALHRRRAVDERLADLVREAVREGSVRGDLPPELTSRLLFGTVNSLAEWVRPDGRYDAEALADAVTLLTFEGLDARRRDGSLAADPNLG
jgi:AcrR family transcriptional regulator